MKDVKDKIVEAQVIAKDAVTEVSAMINQHDITKDNLLHLHKRLKELSQVLNRINEDQAEK